MRLWLTALSRLDGIIELLMQWQLQTKGLCLAQYVAGDEVDLGRPMGCEILLH